MAKRPRLAKSTPHSLRILGVMTGTSCDGLDAACIEIGPNGWTPLWSSKAAYPSQLRKKVLAYQKPRTSQTLQSWLEIHRSLGQWYGASLRKIIEDNSPEPDIIANHGQTIAHYPTKSGGGSTLQLGDPARIGHATGLTVVSNFREGDMAAGGQGAPLAPLFHQLLAKQLGFADGGIAIHNLGGISNLSYIGTQDSILAFDSGPGNIWIDAATELYSKGKARFDKNGQLAQAGRIDTKAVDKILRHPYFRKAAPKSTGRDDFPFELLTQITRTRGIDLIATATAITVESIALTYEKAIIDKHYPLHATFYCGGGAKNTVLMDWLQQRMPYTRVKTLDDVGLDGQLIESQAFAYFGFLSLLGHPLGGPWTGAKGFAPPGHILPGLNWTEITTKLATWL